MQQRYSATVLYNIVGYIFLSCVFQFGCQCVARVVACIETSFVGQIEKMSEAAIKNGWQQQAVIEKWAL